MRRVGEPCDRRAAARLAHPHPQAPCARGHPESQDVLDQGRHVGAARRCTNQGFAVPAIRGVRPGGPGASAPGANPSTRHLRQDLAIPEMGAFAGKGVKGPSRNQLENQRPMHSGTPAAPRIASVRVLPGRRVFQCVQSGLRVFGAKRCVCRTPHLTGAEPSEFIFHGAFASRRSWTMLIPLTELQGVHHIMTWLEISIKLVCVLVWV